MSFIVQVHIDDNSIACMTSTKKLGFLASNSPEDAYSDLHFETSEGSFFNSSRTAGDRVPSRGVFIEGERHMRFLHLKKGLFQKAFQARYEHRSADRRRCRWR
jgi:hypothetical protein